ncbi:MAG TPA: glycosyltransferase [Mycobacteriales bacterium]|nr:glycosyltransferase [Mycobacteriales bacterium]
MTDPRALRVGVLPDTAQQSTDRGGRIWANVLAELRPLVDVVVDEPRRKSLLRRASNVDVWLLDGHAEAVETAEPQVVVAHDTSWLDPTAALPRENRVAMSATTGATLRRATLVIVPTQHLKAQLVGAFSLPEGRVHVVPCGVDPGVHGPVAAGGADLVATRSGQRAPYVLAVTTTPRADITPLLAAFDGFTALALPHVLVVAGTGRLDQLPSADPAAGLPSASAKVVRIENPSDAQIAGLMADCSAFCDPSTSDEVGLTVLEAMACGAPVVVSDRGALPEVVGGAGLVVPPDATALRAALHRVMTDHALAERLGAAAADRAQRQTWAGTASGWASVLRGAAAPR